MTTKLPLHQAREGGVWEAMKVGHGEVWNIAQLHQLLEGCWSDVWGAMICDECKQARICGGTCRS